VIEDVKPPLTCGDAVEPPIGIEPMTYSLRVRAKPSIEVRGTSAPLGGGPNDSVSSDRIRVAVSKLLASTWGDAFERGGSTASLTGPTSREARGPCVRLREPLNPALRLWAWRSSRPRTTQQSRAVMEACYSALQDVTDRSGLAPMPRLTSGGDVSARSILNSLSHPVPEGCWRWSSWQPPGRSTAGPAVALLAPDLPCLPC